MKVIINGCYGGWSVSDEAVKLMFERTGIQIGNHDDSRRSDPELVRIVDELGDRANGRSAQLFIEDIPDNYGFWIEEYDGIETVHLSILEDTLRKLICEGNEDKIVEYVMNAG